MISSVTEASPDLVIVDMQMGNMGGMAVTLELRLQESYDALDHIPVLMILDRRPDVFLARRSGAEGWLVKPLDPLRLRRAVNALLDDGTFADDSFTPVPVLVGSEPQLSRDPSPVPEPPDRGAPPRGIGPDRQTVPHALAPRGRGGRREQRAARPP